MNIQAKVAQDKEKHPEKFCPAKRCLWRTGGGYCPRHNRTDTLREAPSWIQRIDE